MSKVNPEYKESRIWRLHRYWRWVKSKINRIRDWTKIWTK